jgi:Secretion system C-terminal sorting domain
MWGPLGLFAYIDSTNYYASAFWMNGYCYNPRIVGNMRLYSDALNFKNVPIGTNDSVFLDVLMDTEGSIFRALLPLGVQKPFYSADSIIPEFCESLSTQGDYFHFQPTQIGHYVETTYLYDPIRKDSTMLILIGEGVAPDVVNSTPQEPPMQVYPNPCDQFANIVLPSEDLEQVEIRNALGAVVQSYPNVNSDFTMDVSSLGDGIYFIEARSDGAIVTKKLVVIH